MAATTAGNEVVLKDHHGRILRLSLRELLFSDRATLIPRDLDRPRTMPRKSPRCCWGSWTRTTGGSSWSGPSTFGSFSPDIGPALLKSRVKANRRIRTRRR